MARGFSAPASEEAHRLLRELLDDGEAEPSEGGNPARPPVRDERDSPATAAGSALHGILERLDLAGDLRAQLAAARSSLAVVMEGLIGPERRGEAVRRAGEILARLAAGPLPARLAAIAPHVLARELSVLLPPEDAGGPVGFVAGAIDLLYRDPASGELVIADYKSDEVTGDDEVAARAASYAPQGAVYRRAVALALRPPRPPRFELWFLHAGIVVAGS